MHLLVVKLVIIIIELYKDKRNGIDLYFYCS